MKTSIIFSALFCTLSASADIASDIKVLAKKFESKTGVGFHQINSDKITETDRCFIGINFIDGQEASAINFEITIGTHTSGTDLESWTYENTVINRTPEKATFIRTLNRHGKFSVESLSVTQNEVTFTTVERPSNGSKQGRFQIKKCHY